MYTLLTIFHVFLCIILTLVVLLQSGRGGGMGAAFGGAGQQVFGGRGAAPFLTKVTTGAAIMFFITSLTLSMLSSSYRSPIESQLNTKTTQSQNAAEQTAPVAGTSGGATEQSQSTAPTNNAPAPATPPATK
jgi:preprotein translocase subunit SecG